MTASSQMKARLHSEFKKNKKRRTRRTEKKKEIKNSKKHFIVVDSF